jgi:hypothetical protein
MNTILRRPDESRYNVSEHLEFHQLSYAICNRYSEEIDAPDMIEAYIEALEQEEAVYKWLRKSEFTQKKAEADHARDFAYTGMLATVRASLKHFDPEIRDCARHVYNLLENYGNLPKTGYDSETAEIDNLVKRLLGADYATAVGILKIELWIDELNSKNELFKSYVDDTAHEQTGKPDISPRDARRVTDEALRQITSRITSLITLNGKADFAAFAEEFNVLVNHYNTLVHEHYGRLHARADITQAVIAPIAVQQFTGKPVFVIPEASLAITLKDKTTVVDLIFSQDFTVAYKNNVNPGTATLIITGIGKYVGELVTTFNIERSL